MGRRDLCTHIPGPSKQLPLPLSKHLNFLKESIIFHNFSLGFDSKKLKLVSIRYPMFMYFLRDVFQHLLEEEGALSWGGMLERSWAPRGHGFLELTR